MDLCLSACRCPGIKFKRDIGRIIKSVCKGYGSCHGKSVQ